VEWVRAAAAEATAQIGPPAARAIPALLKAANDPEDRVRTAVAIALGNFGPQAAQVMSALIDLLKKQR
jgi:HEAT repeat protein